ncbi:DUF2786 domain-containing protein [Xanthobacter sp. V0B-10]|uniref:DUF2786 domain-containing protein n=1 Tax=Xanthobacter albus TaxID=3119929 RepID=UPI00372C55D6
MLASIGIPPLEDFRMSQSKELPLVRRRVEALLKKTVANGCTPSEAAAAFEKAEELVAKYGIDPGHFRWPPRPSTIFGSASSGPEAPKAPRASVAGRGKGSGRLAERLIVEHSDWTYAAVAAEVNRQIEGAKASEKSVRWYASRMRWRGDDVPLRQSKKAAS